MTEILTSDQDKALHEILGAIKSGAQFLLTGHAGAGKTTLMWHLTRELQKRRLSVVLTAPTHKAVAVLSAKLRGAGIADVDCRTIHSLLSLKPKPHGDRMIFTRAKHADPVMQDVVVIDECSMVDEALLGHIKRHLPVSFVVFVGDPAQLPPVGEVESKTFETKNCSHLDTIVRQSADNPLLDAAHTIRKSQGGPFDMTWCKSSNAPPFGVFVPSACDEWLKKAFTSKEFDEDPDRFRYLAWTNARVAEVNSKVRRWRYGSDMSMPFMPGEMALVRAPIIQDDTILFNTNEESQVLEISESTYEHTFREGGGVKSWVATIPSWKIKMTRADGMETSVHMPSNDKVYNQAIARIIDEASSLPERWSHLHRFKSSMAKLQSIYALTVHNSQGSTMKNVFVDIGDIRRRASTNVLECQQLMYVAATRPTHGLFLVNA